MPVGSARGACVSHGVLFARHESGSVWGCVDGDLEEREEEGGMGTLPALYCVTLCIVCFLHSLPLQ